MKRLVLESTAPFQGLPELVAYDEGLLEKEGLDIEWVAALTTIDSRFHRLRQRLMEHIREP